RTVVVLVPAILDPLPDVAVHVVKPQRVRLKRSNGSRLLEIPSTAAAVAIGVAHARIVAPGIAGIGASPRGVLPFGLCQKPVLLASQLREPAYILLGVAPAHVDTSVRSRYSLPVNCESQPTYCLASPQ